MKQDILDFTSERANGLFFLPGKKLLSPFHNSLQWRLQHNRQNNIIVPIYSYLYAASEAGNPTNTIVKLTSGNKTEKKSVNMV